MAGKLDDYLQFHQSALNLRAQRQQLLASNIANADTPNYKARDIDFNATLQRAMKTPGGAAATGVVDPGPANLVRTSANHLAGKPMPVTGGVNAAKYKTPAQGSVDGNTVDMDAERNQFTDNALRYEAGITLIGSQIKSMLTAIQGQ